MQTKQKLILSLLSGVLLSASWPFIGSLTPLIFIALLPLLWIDFGKKTNRKTSFLYPYLTFFVWHLISIYWLYNVEGGFATKFFSYIMPAVVNSTSMALAWHLALRFGKQGKINMRLFTLFSFWLAYEYFHLDWDLSFPWFQLGNVFASSPSVVQFYSYTGVLGGSAWVLLGNFVLLKLILLVAEGKHPKAWVAIKAVSKILIICVPLILSSSIDYEPTLGEKTVSIAAVQPNIDPYTEKFSGKSVQVELEELLELVNKEAPSAQLYVFPETTLQERTNLNKMGEDFVPVGLWENDISNSYSARVLRTHLVHDKNADVLIGMSSDSLMPKGTEASFLNRPISGTGLFYRSYNAALFQTKVTDAVYNKSKLVPGVETTPFSSFFKHFKSLAMNLGGTTGGLGTQATRTVFISEYNKVGIAPIICFESIYGEYVTEFVRNGAGVLAVITNDAWWGNSAGHKQHLMLSQLRAIENRRWIVRSANTGVSAIIDPEGELVSETKYDERTVLTGTVKEETQLTFYTRFGDYIGRLASFLAVMFILLSVTKRLKSVKENQNNH
jgi:apolipoprotein N-acyltransferase